MIQKNFQYKNTTIAYTVIGKGNTIILLHGFGETSATFIHQINFLKKHFQLIIPDIPGSGNSSLLKVSATKNSNDLVKYPTEISDYADCIKLLLEYENIEQCIMLGHSMGGYITLAFAEKYQNNLKGFGLLHSTAFADNATKKENRMRSIEMIEAYGGYSFLKNVIPTYFGEKYKAEHAATINEFIKAATHYEKDALQQYYFAMMNRPDRTNVLSKANIPILFIIGEEDIAAPMQDMLQQSKLPQLSYVHILKNTGHMGMWEATENVNNYLLSFCTDVFKF